NFRTLHEQEQKYSDEMVQKCKAACLIRSIGCHHVCFFTFLMTGSDLQIIYSRNKGLYSSFRCAIEKLMSNQLLSYVELLPAISRKSPRTPYTPEPAFLVFTIYK
ncbi:hypothetical protein BRADI_4g21261v3, partial [Brachypodium distachyon]